MLPVAKIERLIKACGSRADPVHDFGHLRRVARGAAWFVQMSGGSRAEQEAAYVAGLLHDIVRPLTNAAGHALASARYANALLKRLKVETAAAEQVTAAIADHGGITKWNSAVHQSVFFADKVFEQMGALVLFRRCTWVGECKEIQKGTVQESVIREFVRKLSKHKRARFPAQFRPIVKSQLDWPMRFLAALRAGEGWALYLAAAGFRNGAIDKLSIDAFARRFRPIAAEDAAARAEALVYITGRKWPAWTDLVRH